MRKFTLVTILQAVMWLSGIVLMATAQTIEVGVAGFLLVCLGVFADWALLP